MHFKISYFVVLFFYVFQNIGLNFILKKSHQKKIVKIINIAYITILDLFLLSLLENNKILIVLTGVFIIIYCLFVLIKYFLYGSELIKKHLILDCILLFISVTVVIYNLPCQYQNIVLVLASAVFSGIITLVGVAWTIKDGTEKRNQELLRIENERKEEERIRHIPYVKISANEKHTSFIKIELKGEFDINNNELINTLVNSTFYSVSFKDFLIKNISNSNIILEGIKIDEHFYPFNAKTLLEVNSCCKFVFGDNFYYPFSSKPALLNIYVKDIIGNLYEINCMLQTESDCNLPSTVVNKYNEDFTEYSYTYTIISTDLPVLYKGETI